MKKSWVFPIRIKIMISVLLLVTAVVSVITFTMANLFHTDKKAYIHDLASVVSLSTAEECRSLLTGYAEKLGVYARILDQEEMTQNQKRELLQGLFDDFPQLVAVAQYEGDNELVAAFDAQSLDEAGLTKEDLRGYRTDQPLPLESILAGEPFVENSTISPELPTLTLALAQPNPKEASPLIVSAVVRLDQLLRLPARSSVFDVSIVDGRGVLLAGVDPQRVALREQASIYPEMGVLEGEHSAGVTREYVTRGQEMIGGFAEVGFADVAVAAVIPRSAAYLASRSLLRSLLVVALGLLMGAALTGLVWSRRITGPVERLSEVTREIGKGKFDIKVNIESRDEIGTLARSFNQMASELHTRDEDLQTAQQQLVQSEKMAAFGQLGAGIAHEVKNPLAGILGCAQLSLRTAEDGTMLHKNLSLIEKETRRCKTIIENLLKFARQEKAALEPIDVNPVAEDAVAIVNHQLELQQIKILTDLAEQLPQVRGNANQLQQVLMNLMMNAQQAMEGNPGSVTVTTRQLDEGNVEIRVSDTGPGIPKEIQEKLFEPFFTTKPGGKGTGLGLSVSYGIIEDHRGQVRVESEVGEGATFIISLPALPAEVSDRVN